MPQSARVRGDGLRPASSSSIEQGAAMMYHRRIRSTEQPETVFAWFRFLSPVIFISVRWHLRRGLPSVPED
jgi:hypothetical protein